MSNSPIRAKVVVVGLGPAGPDLITASAQSALEGDNVWLRTTRHPAAVAVTDARSFDYVYDAAEKIDDVYRTIVDVLAAEALEAGSVTYAVPGSPLVAETTVDLLRADERVDVEIRPALSFLDVAWLRLGVDPLAASPRLIDGHRFSIEAAGERGPLLIAQCDAPWVLSEIKLAYEDATPESVVALQRLGLPDESVVELEWADLDRLVAPDHLTSLWIPKVATPVAFELSRVDSVARRLRSECPWDREQTHESLGRYLVEESYELLDAIEAQTDENTNDEHLIEELGDVLYQVFAHAAIAESQGRFTVADVAQLLSDKLIERHPHVYGEDGEATIDEVIANWEANKIAAKGRDSIMDGIPAHLPALLYAAKVISKAASLGIVYEHIGAGVGLNLLSIVSDLQGEIDAEDALRRATTEFRLKVERYEGLAREEGVDLRDIDDASRQRIWTAASNS